MKRSSHILTLVMVMLTGCVNYAPIEQTRMGMTLQEFSYLDTPCYYRGENGESIQYSCKFKMPTGSIRPYIMTFTDGRLTEILVDENELDRQMMQDRIDLQYHLYHPRFGYYYGYPGPCCP